ncbi:MAG: RNA-binding protein [Polaromonas sp.]
MKPFAMHPKMSTIQGAFYPTGHAFVMFPDAATAQEAARQLEAIGIDGDHIMLLTPEVILRDIGKIDGLSHVALPSVGTEGATVHRYIEFAREGHHGLMIQSPSDAHTERVMSVLRELPFSYGQKYHLLAIEDLE